jgi:hypothetical protein
LINNRKTTNYKNTFFFAINKNKDKKYILKKMKINMRQNENNAVVRSKKVLRIGKKVVPLPRKQLSNEKRKQMNTTDRGFLAEHRR